MRRDPVRSQKGALVIPTFKRATRSSRRGGRRPKGPEGNW
jgi:hypothetical protein